MEELRTVRVDRTDVDLQAGRVLRLALAHSDDGTDDTLTLALAWASDRRADEHQTIHLPAGCLPRLVEALEALAEAS